MLTALLCTAVVAALSTVALLPEVIEQYDAYDASWTVGASFTSGLGHRLNRQGKREIEADQNRRRAAEIRLSRVLDTPDMTDRRAA